MLETVKSYIKDLPDVTFGEFYQKYICDVQDQNVLAEINTVKTESIVSLEKLLVRLNQKLN